MRRSRHIRQSTSIRLRLLGNAEGWSLVTPWQGRYIKLDAAASPAVTHSPLELCKLMVTDTVLSPSYRQAISASTSACKVGPNPAKRTLFLIHEMEILRPTRFLTLCQ